MFKITISSLLIISLNLCIADDSVLNGTELVMTFLVHRHGDRTPVSSTISYSTDRDTVEALTAKHGYGQLTEKGINRGYELGQFLRNRYNELLSDSFNRSEIYIRSTDSTRAKMTVLAAMSAVYPAGFDNWSRKINWTPVPYTTVPAKYDFILATLNCPVFITKYYSLMTESFSSMDEYADILNTWSEYLGWNITAYPIMAYLLYDVYVSQVNLGVALDPAIEAIYTEIGDAAAAAMDIVYGDEDTIALQAGVLLNEFFTYADMKMAGNDTPSVRVYSAHDVNVFAFESVTQVTTKQGVPKYGSMYALELRKVSATGAYVVLPVYLATPSEDTVTYLQITGCDDLLCDIEQFRNVTADYILDEDTWRTECGWTADLTIDDSSIG